MKPFRLLSLLLLAMMISAFAREDRRLEFADIIEQREPYSPRISPDGQAVAFLVRQSSLKENNTKVQLWIVEKDKPSRCLLQDTSISGLEWIPGRPTLSVKLSKTGTTVLWQISLDTANVQPLMDHPTPVFQYAWAPDGSQLLFVTAKGATAEERSRIDREGVIYNENIHGIRSFTQRNWTSPGVQELWLWKMGQKQARRVEPDVFPVQSFGRLDWAPGGDRVAIQYQAGNSSDHIGILKLDGDVFSFQPVVEQNLANRGVTWHPDGRQLAYVATGDEHLYYVPRSRPLVLRLGEKDPLPVANGRDWYFLSSVFFDRQGENLLIEYDDRRNSTLYRTPLAGGAIKAIPVDGAHYSEFSFCRDKRYAACIRQKFTIPPEVALVDIETGRADVLTRLNPQFETIRLREGVERRWKNRLGNESNGFLIMPPKPWKEPRLPLLVLHYQFSNKFTVQAQWMTSYPVQHFVEAGFAVLMLNYPRELGWKPGDFAAAARSQVYNPLSGMETAVKSLVEEGIADPQRVGILGWSFGAFLAEMAITQSDLFQAASAGEGGLNNAGQYWVTGSAAMQRYLDAFFGGPPFGDAYDNYRKVAPALNADKVKVPLLREYGSDVGVQSLEFYMALKRLEKPVEQVIYPGAPHVFSLPSHRLASMERNLDWFRFWLQGYENPDPGKVSQYERWRAMRTKRRSVGPE